MLHVDRVTRRFGALQALRQVSLNVPEGRIFSLVGTSGCGKSTLLRIVGGLDRPDEGGVDIDGRPVTGPRAEIGMVFQEPRLMPWLTVDQNVRFGIQALPAAEQAERVRQALGRVGLERFAGAWPRALSGGMAQRVAIARALVARPSIMLLDEPFSALDSFTRQGLQHHLEKLWREERLTMLFVTHDIEEAVALSDVVVVMRGHPGRIHRIVNIDLPRPRRRSAPDFQQLRDEILDSLDLGHEEEDGLLAAG